MFELTYILEVCSSVVKWIFVDVVTDESIRGVCDNPVHTNEVNAALACNLTASIQAAK